MPINSEHPLYTENKSKWKRARDCANGTDAVKDGGELYLPKLTGQTDTEYKAMKARAMFFNATERTVKGLVGAVMRKDPIFEFPEAYDYSDNITNTGISLTKFTGIVVEELFTTGRYGLLIDRAVNGSRPYVSGYSAENIFNWRIIDGVTQMVVLREFEYVREEADDPYKIKQVEIYRELVLDNGVYTVNIYRKDDKGAYSLSESYIPTKSDKKLTKIPFYFVNVNGLNNEIEKPPILDLADVNLSHYRTSADLEHGRHWTALPTPVAIGLEDTTKKLSVGSQTAWLLPPDGDAKYLEFTGQGLQSLEKAIEQKEDNMARLGARLLNSPKAAAESADKAKLDQSSEAVTVTTIAVSAETGIKAALESMYEWENISSKWEYEINRDFVVETLDAQLITSIGNQVIGGLLSHQTYYEYLQQLELTNPERSFEDEKDLILKDSFNVPDKDFEEDEDEEDEDDKNLNANS